MTIPPDLPDDIRARIMANKLLGRLTNFQDGAWGERAWGRRQQYIWPDGIYCVPFSEFILMTTHFRLPPDATSVWIYSKDLIEAV
jgi:hypothetical protein